MNNKEIGSNDVLINSLNLSGNINPLKEEKGLGHLPNGQSVHHLNESLGMPLPEAEEENEINGNLHKSHQFLNDSQLLAQSALDNDVDLGKMEKNINGQITNLENCQGNRDALVVTVYTENQIAGILFPNIELAALGTEIALEAREVVEGKKFFEAVFPPEVQENLKFFEHLEGLSEAIALGGLVLSSAHSGFNLLALIYKTHLFGQAAKILEEAKAQLQLMEDSGKESPEQINRIRASLEEWEALIDVQRTALHMEKNVFGFSFASMAVKWVTTPLHYLPLNSLPAEAAQVTGALLGGASYVMQGLEMVVLGFEFFHTRHNQHLAKEWIEEYHEWRDEQKVTYKRVKITPDEALFSFFDRSTFEGIKQSLKTRGIIIGVSTKEALIDLIKRDEEVRKGIFNALKDELPSHILELKKPAETLYFSNPKIEQQYREHFEKEFIGLLEKLDFTGVESLLRRLNISLDKNIHNKEGIKDAWINDNDFKEKVLNNYVEIQKELNRFICLSKDLLEKRKNIRNKKVKDLELKFEDKREEIEALQYQTFSLSMARIFNEVNKKSRDFGNYNQAGLRSYQSIEEELNQWNVNKEVHEDLFDALENVKAVERQMSKYIANPEVYSVSEETKSKYAKIHADFESKLEAFLTNRDARQDVFKAWKNVQNPKKELEDYVDRHETFEQTTKNALNELVKRKHEIEKKFIDFKANSMKKKFFVAAISFTITATLGVLTLLTAPIPGIGALFLGLTCLSTGLSVGLLAQSLYYSFSLKPKSTRAMLFKGIYLRLAYSNIRIGIANYEHQSKHKKLLMLERRIEDLIGSEIQLNEKRKREIRNLFKARDQLDKELKKVDEKVENWKERLKGLSLTIAQNGWIDFTTQASLKEDANQYYDSLETFNYALKECDLSLLSKETKELLTKYMGIDLERLQRAIETDPDAFKNHIRSFFGMTDADLIFFIRKQRNLEEMRHTA